ncbi:MAG: FAD-dependent oxidoreductase [Steroidobacteraceae bacterium]|jgi:3-phenylpropionate/trans-cinnamate dioxygenase ferredoxin reductase subunit|nr:FAD-dependent oxidoreductase [Steroidobacteraceae bacterium]
MIERIVIVGAGQAAAQAVDVLRRRRFEGSIALVGDEPFLPYQRPPLSKKYFSGTLARDRLPIRHQSFYDEHRVDVRLGRRAVSIDRAARQVALDDGVALPYDALILATGSTPRRLQGPGTTLQGLHYLRTIEDTDRLREAARPGARAVVVGGGYIGLEVAATCRELGVEVTVLEMADRVMNRVVCETVSRYYEAEHRRHGVELVLGARMEAFVGDAAGRVAAVRCADGREYRADFAVIGIGVLAQDALARAAGLHCDNGIAVDEHCRTSDPAIWAIGDCTSHPSLRYGYRVRLESVDNAFEQAGTAALDILGTPVPHDKVPWFWSDQYHHKLLIVGLSQGHDEVVLRGDPATHGFSCAYLRDGELIAIDTVNSAKDQMAARKLVAARVRPDRARLADPAVPLKECVPA